jgi:hypothetical protein
LDILRKEASCDSCGSTNITSQPVSFLASDTSIVMDAAKTFTKPLNSFMVDSVRLVRRCNKPDRKGTFSAPQSSTSRTSKRLFPPPSCLRSNVSVVPDAEFVFRPRILLRVYEDFDCNSNRLWRNGFHRLLRAPHPHPDKQYTIGLDFTDADTQAQRPCTKYHNNFPRRHVLRQPVSLLFHKPMHSNRYATS